MSDVQQFYGRWAGPYDAVARYAPLVGRLRARTVEALELSAGDTVVDVGCGTGANLPFLREQVGPGGTVVGVDVTGPMLARARRLVADRGWENVHLVRGDGAGLPLAGPVDGVVASFVVGMFADPAGVVDGWCDLAAGGGRVALLNLAPSDRPAAAPVNAAFEVVTALSTPPTLKLRYEEPLGRQLRERVAAGHDVLEARGDRTTHEQHLLGFARLSAARIE